MRAQDPAAALRTLDDYDARFAHGSLREEADVARIQALLDAGDSAGATTKAQAFLAAHPQSAYTKRVRAMLAKTNR